MTEQTSLLAYKKFYDNLFNNQEKVIIELLQATPGGLTINEINEYTTFKINAVCGRIGDLRKKGFIKENGLRKNIKSNVNNKVWVII